MSDAAAIALVTALIQITGMIVGFLTLWVKLRYSAEKAEEAVVKAKLVEDKLDDNTATTNSLSAKADTIVQQTDGTMEAIRILIAAVADRVSKLEDYNRDSSHRLIDAVNAVHLKLASMAMAQQLAVQVKTSDVPEKP